MLGQVQVNKFTFPFLAAGTRQAGALARSPSLIRPACMAAGEWSIHARWVSDHGNGLANALLLDVHPFKHAVVHACTGHATARLCSDHAHQRVFFSAAGSPSASACRRRSRAMDSLSITKRVNGTRLLRELAKSVADETGPRLSSVLKLYMRAYVQTPVCCLAAGNEATSGMRRVALDAATRWCLQSLPIVRYSHGKMHRGYRDSQTNSWTDKALSNRSNQQKPIKINL